MSQATIGSNHRKNLGDILVTSIMFNDPNATTVSTLGVNEASGSAAVTFSGASFNANLIQTLKFTRLGNIVYVTIPSDVTATSATAARLTATALPARLWPTVKQNVSISGTNNAVASPLLCNISTSGVMSFGPGTETGTFTAAAAASISNQTFSYVLA